MRGYERGEWRHVTRIAIEYSFTKEPRMAAFVEVLSLLEREGFTTMYEGKEAAGSGWRRGRGTWTRCLLFAAARDSRGEEDTSPGLT